MSHSTMMHHDNFVLQLVLNLIACRIHHGSVYHRPIRLVRVPIFFPLSFSWIRNTYLSTITWQSILPTNAFRESKFTGNAGACSTDDSLIFATHWTTLVPLINWVVPSAVCIVSWCVDGLYDSNPPRLTATCLHAPESYINFDFNPCIAIEAFSVLPSSV